MNIADPLQPGVTITIVIALLIQLARNLFENMKDLKSYLSRGTVEMLTRLRIVHILILVLVPISHFMSYTLYLPTKPKAGSKLLAWNT